MNVNTEFRCMKKQSPYTSKPKTSYFLPMVGGLIAISCWMLKQFYLVPLNTELVLAPFLVIILLMFGEHLLLIGLVCPLKWMSKYFLKVKGSFRYKHQKLNQPSLFS